MIEKQVNDCGPLSEKLAIQRWWCYYFKQEMNTLKIPNLAKNLQIFHDSQYDKRWAVSGKFLQQTLPEIFVHIQLNEKLLIFQDDLPAFTYLHSGSYDEFS